MRLVLIALGAAMSLVPAAAQADCIADGHRRCAPPSIELPVALKPYANVGMVIDTAHGVIKLLGSAKFDAVPSGSPLGKAPCDAPEIASFYRGMTLMQAGYFIFINKMERGFEAVDSPHPPLPRSVPLLRRDFGALVRPGRELLVAAWDKGKRKRLLSLVTAASKLPLEVKADLAAYFNVLREFAQRYDALRRRAPADLAELNRRATLLYHYERTDKLRDAKSRGASALRQAEQDYPEYLYYEAHAKELRKLLDANRDIGMARVNECFDGGKFAELRFGENDEMTYHPYGLYPTSYMIGFWRRREFEGTSALARFAIDRLLAATTSAN